MNQSTSSRFLEPMFYFRQRLAPEHYYLLGPSRTHISVPDFRPWRQVTLSLGASGTRPQSCSRSAASNFPSSARTLLKISWVGCYGMFMILNGYSVCIYIYNYIHNTHIIHGFKGIFRGLYRILNDLNSGGLFMDEWDIWLCLVYIWIPIVMGGLPSLNPLKLYINTRTIDEFWTSPVFGFFFCRRSVCHARQCQCFIMFPVVDVS